MPDVFDNEFGAPWNETEDFECPVCDGPTDREGEPCSSRCHEVDMM